MNTKMVVMKNITKKFPGVLALEDVSFEAEAGEVHILLGENGAGKSTLTKILSGVHNPTAGTISVDGEPYSVQNVKEAQEKGVNMIFQELNLIPHLSVAENIYLGRAPQKGLHISWDQMNKNAEEILKSLHVDIAPTQIVKTLGIAKQQMVEIAKALSFKSKIIVMDEPTAALTNTEIEQLFATIQRLKKEGVCIIYISHRMEELMKIGDRVTILRDGRYVSTVNVKDTSMSELIRMMVGRTLEQKFPKEISAAGKERLRVENLNQEKHRLRDISFSIRAGEVVGFSGLMGAGRTEVMRAVFGADSFESGKIFVDGKQVNIKSAKDAISHKIGFLTENRKEQGLVLQLGSQKNITLACQNIIKGRMGFNLKKETQIADKLVSELDIKTPSITQKVKFLSGGNQQKVVLAKWLASDSNIVIFDEPTRGIDVGAKVEIYKIINKLTKQGNAVIMISSELPEIIGMSDRIYVMCGGQITGELSRDEVTQEKIMALATGGA